MDKIVASRLIRINRKVAWLLVLFSIFLIITGYGQSLHLLRRHTMRDLHLISEWFFIVLLAFHVFVGTFLARYRYGSSIKSLLARRAGLGVLLRFILRVTSWPLLVLSIIIILSGLSWYKILVISFNQHIEVDAPFFIFFVIHTAVGAGVASKRILSRWGRNKDH